MQTAGVTVKVKVEGVSRLGMRATYQGHEGLVPNRTLGGVGASGACVPAVCGMRV